MNEVIYTKDELIDKTDKELLEILCKSWGLNDNRIYVWGELRPMVDDKYGFLTNVHLVETGILINYPLEGIKSDFAIFVGSSDVARCGSTDSITYVSCELELSKMSRRQKLDNPLLLTVKKRTIMKLKALSKEIPLNIISKLDNKNEIKQFIWQTIYDLHEEEVLKKVSLELDILEQKKNVSITVTESLNTKCNELELNIKKLSEEKVDKEHKIQIISNKLEKFETEMNNKIKRLRSYLGEKALFLKTFEFIDEEELNGFLFESQTHDENIDGVLFNELLDNDYEQAVSYIQSYLVNNDILYPRHIIENFLTLLRTKDLIILAGDSGSGKTNLVKSFAKAVGGKSFIIPVKPNWTSSEDLLGYYNPLEKKYLATPFLEALIEAKNNPKVPYFICLDEMNLARVEYYFADFLSLLETRDEQPEIVLYAQDEASHVLSELKAVVDIIQSSKEKYKKEGVVNFIELLKDDTLNSQLRLAFGFSDKDSLLKYHNEIRRMLSAVVTTPSSIKIPENVYIVGAINIDETTHYLSPKILDRAHIMRFESPLLSDWDAILQEVAMYGFDDTSKPLLFDIESLGYRSNYPKFDRDNEFCKLFITLNKEFFHKLGVEFGMRTIRQGLNYLELFQDVNKDLSLAINNFLLHKILPKLTFDGNKHIGDQTKLELLERVFLERIKTLIPNFEDYNQIFSAVHALENVVSNAKSNDGIVNYWS